MKKNEMKKNPLMNMMKKSLLDLPTPTSISYLWNMGFMLGMILTMQIITGLMVSMIYTSDTNISFQIMVKIMRDNSMGWTTRMLHMNGASLFFILLYMHTARGIYFSSPSNQKKVWMTGVALMLMTMATAFLGYVLPWGQMSFWGATVITGVLTAIPFVGNELVTWIWGGPSVSNPTLNRFFSLHFILPMAIMAMMLVHLIMLHEKGSSNPSNTTTKMDKIKFNPMYSLKDILPMMITMTVMMLMVSNYPNMLGDVENFSPANPLVAPMHIQPEWYFLFAYVILRSIPSKLGGVVALMMSIMILTVMVKTKKTSTKFKTYSKMKFWMLISVIMILTWIGAKPVETPFEQIGQTYTILYFTLMMTL